MDKARIVERFEAKQCKPFAARLWELLFMRFHLCDPAPWLNRWLAYTMMFTKVIYTVVFKINPLMRFDGHYMLTDWPEIPNLHQQAQQQFQRWWRTSAVRCRR